MSPNVSVELLCWFSRIIQDFSGHCYWIVMRPKQQVPKLRMLFCY